MSVLSPVTPEHIASEKLIEPILLQEVGGGSPISHSLTPLGSYPNPCEFFLYLNFGNDLVQTQLQSKSFEGDCDVPSSY